ncbi:uncharacterized protein LOC18423072 isoform X1 [Amborella trichopoda]|uniref:uncharacterized protein LOC18423072 isoform X1 n=2 Tax=Amborella trichopoda TaxID=13333 RepID=UPI0009C0C314|nr:uncharacterized protein LOC18423072 isoform X1 [Amborella trichopoda]|eukprot:XP_020526001.1 uncharacterized protein LOC18423072 isoform X1 [Amborella trichopoda]
MDGLTNCYVGRFFIPLKQPRIGFRSPKFVAMASDGGSKFDHWDRMEMKFGRMMGEDPKLTLAKIMGRKENPDASYLEIEEAYYRSKKKMDKKNKGNLDMDAADFAQFEVREAESSNMPANSSLSSKSMNVDKKLNLMRPVMKKGSKSVVPLVKPVAVERPRLQSSEKIDTKSSEKIDTKGDTSNVILRKPSIPRADDIEMKEYSRVHARPNLSLNRSKEASQDFSNIILLKKPEPLNSSDASEEKGIHENSSGAVVFDRGVVSDDANLKDIKLLEPIGKETIGIDPNMKSNALNNNLQNNLEGSLGEERVSELNNSIGGPIKSVGNNSTEMADQENGHGEGMHPSALTIDEQSSKELTNVEGLNASTEHPLNLMKATLQGKPSRVKSVDSSIKEQSRAPSDIETKDLDGERYNDATEHKHFISSESEAHKTSDWARAEMLVHTGDRVEVELINCSSRGFVASFGSLIGFLPYKKLGTRWKFLAFESWLKKSGLDPSLFRTNLGVLGVSESPKFTKPEVSLEPEMDKSSDDKVTQNSALDDLLDTYDQEKTKFLSSFVGQRIKVHVILADRKARRLLFSGKPKETDEMIEKKRTLMGKLNIGDVVKCHVTKITYFGIFVEVEGVPALIHQSEVSWEATLDPSAFYKVGQDLEAKVLQLDFSLERISLSLKQLTQPDPLFETLESVIDGQGSLSRTLEAVQLDEEWSDVEALIKELQQTEGVQSVSKGRLFLSPGLVPTFQVYMGSMFDNHYKLLARSGNKVQEVVVQASLDKEQMKSAILRCTSSVQ